MMKREGSSEANCIGTIVQLFSQPPEGAASLLPAAMDKGEIMDWGFIPAKLLKWINSSNWLVKTQWQVEAAFCSVVLVQQQRTWEKKAFMKSLQHYTMSPNSIVILNLVWVSQHFKQVLGVSLAHRLHRHWYYWNRTLAFYDGTDVHLNVSNFAVVWSGCVHMPWCLWGKNIYFRSLMRKSLWYWIFKQILLNLPLIKIVSAYYWILS